MYMLCFEALPLDPTDSSGIQWGECPEVMWHTGMKVASEMYRTANNKLTKVTLKCTATSSVTIYCN